MICRLRCRRVFDEAMARTGSEDHALWCVAQAATMRERERLANREHRIAKRLLEVRSERPHVRRAKVVTVTAAQVAAVVAAVARAFGLKGPWSVREDKESSWVAGWVLVAAGMSLPQAAVALWFANHTSLLYARKKVEGDADLLKVARGIHGRLFPVAPAQGELFARSRARRAFPAPAQEIAA